MLHYILANHKLNLQVENYLNDLVSDYLYFIDLLEPRDRNYERRLLVDCSNSVASPYMAQLANMIRDVINVDLINVRSDEPDKLNLNCGAKYV